MEHTAEKIKKTRKPRSEAAKQATREKMLANAEKLRQENNGVAATPETLAKRKANGVGKHTANNKMKRMDGSKAHKLVSSLLGLVNDIHCAMHNPEVLGNLQKSFPDADYRWSASGKEIQFNRSATEIRKHFGAIGLEIWKKVFKCVQPGGFSEKNQAGFATLWSLNKEDWDVFTMHKQRIQARRQTEEVTVSAFMEALLYATEYKRVATEFAVEVKFGVKQVKALKKEMVTAEQAAAKKEERKQFKIANNIQPAGTYRKKFAAKKEAHASAVAESRAIYEKELENV